MKRWMFLLIACSAFAAGPGDAGWEILIAGAGEQDPVKRAKAVTALGTIRLARGSKAAEVYGVPEVERGCVRLRVRESVVVLGR